MCVYLLYKHHFFSLSPPPPCRFCTETTNLVREYCLPRKVCTYRPRFRCKNDILKACSGLLSSQCFFFCFFSRSELFLSRSLWNNSYMDNGEKRLRHTDRTLVPQIYFLTLPRPFVIPVVVIFFLDFNREKEISLSTGTREANLHLSTIYIV